MQKDVGLRVATDGEFRRASWHMDFIYQLGGVVRHPEERLTIEFHSDEGDLEAVFSGMHVEAPLGLSHTIFGDDFVFLRDAVEGATPKLTIPSPSMCITAAGAPPSIRRCTRTSTPSGPT